MFGDGDLGFHVAEVFNGTDEVAALKELTDLFVHSGCGYGAVEG